MCMREGGGQAAPQTPLLGACSSPESPPPFPGGQCGSGPPRDLLLFPKVQVHPSGSSRAPGVEEKGSEDWEGQVRLRDHPGPDRRSWR